MNRRHMQPSLRSYGRVFVHSDPIRRSLLSMGVVFDEDAGTVSFPSRGAFFSGIDRDVARDGDSVSQEG